MPWVKALAGDKERLVALLRHNEWDHLHFSSALKKKSFRWMPNGVVYLLEGDKGVLKGAVYFSKGGALHCCFEPKDLKFDDLNQLTNKVLSRTFFSFIGRSDRISLIEEIYRAERSWQNDYHLLTLPSEAPKVLKKREGYTFRRAYKSDFEGLYPLEEAYQKEEVLRNPELLNATFLKKRFLSQLEVDQIWVALKGNHIIAKGGTNAIGFNYAQIGGVYTIPAERGQGIGHTLMNHLNSSLAQEGWGSALFVRTDNGAANKLYENCGYINRGNFRIVYPE